jgi:hypothetical protein
LARRGGRTVLQGYPSLGLGNYLYFLLHAATEQARGRDYRVVRPALMDYWAPLLQGVEDQLTVQAEAVRLRDRRDDVPGTFFQRFGSDFTRDQLTGFIERFVVGSPPFGEDQGLGDSDTLTVNVRRGDYYAEPAFRQLYGFDVAAYVRIGLERSVRNGGAPRRIHVVSDGMDWCRRELAWLADHAEQLTYAAPEDGPARNFVQIALSRRLIITNSTFSYWGAYISNVVHADNHGQVVAPWFHSRGVDGGRAWQLDPRWDVVDSLPGGWDPPV